MECLTDAFELAILAASLGRFDGKFKPFRLRLDFYVLWRRSAGFFRLRRTDAPTSARELHAHFGDTNHRPGQGVIHFTTEDFRFFGDLLRMGA